MSIVTTLQWVLNSKVGPIFLVASEGGLHGVFWKKQKAALAPSLSQDSPAVKILAKAVQQLEEYLSGKRKAFDLPLQAQGTEFQKKVWQELAKIPYGKTCSYTYIAEKIKNKKAVRAVGTANGKNPLSIIVPCHRVIASNGKLAGYAGGLSVKEKLLNLEGIRLF